MYKISKASQICDNNDHLKWYYNSNSLDSITGILWWTILKNKNSGLYFSTKNYYTFLFNDWSVVCGKSFFLSFPRKFLVGRVFEHTRNPRLNQTRPRASFRNIYEKPSMFSVTPMVDLGFILGKMSPPALYNYRTVY